MEQLHQKEIRKILSHRFPFLLLDKAIKLGENQIVGIKNVSASDQNLVGHFPDEPIYPGVLLIETCAQAGGILINEMKLTQGRCYLAQVKNFKFLKFIVPGDTIYIETNLMSKFSKLIQVSVIAKVDQKIVGSGEIIYTF